MKPLRLLVLSLFFLGTSLGVAFPVNAGGCGEGGAGFLCKAWSVGKWTPAGLMLRGGATMFKAGMSALNWTTGQLRRGYGAYSGWVLEGMGTLSPEEHLALDLGEGMFVEGTMALASGAVTKGAQYGLRGAQALYGLSNYAKMSEGIQAARAFRVSGAIPTTIGDEAIQFGTGVLGRGSGGTVYRGTMEGEEVAVKIITDHYNEARGFTNAGYASAESYTANQARVFQTLAENNMGGVRYYGTTNVGGRTGIVTNLVGDVGPFGSPDPRMAGEWLLSAAEQARFAPKVEAVARQAADLGYVFSDTEYAISNAGEILLMDPQFVPIGEAFVPQGISPMEYSLRQMLFVRPGFIQ